MTQTDGALKPCPFCGGRGHIAKDPDLNHGDFYFVKCAKCRSKSAEFHANETCPIFYAQVRDAWNRRADLAPQRICDWCDETSPQRKARCPVKGCYARADLAATPQDARVKALVEAAARLVANLDEGDFISTTRIEEVHAALAAFNTTDKPQGENNEVKGGKDE